jgi:hypothetical protein
MMNKRKIGLLMGVYRFVLIVLVFLLPTTIKGQYLKTSTFTITIADVSLIRINPLTTISMNLLATMAGESMTPKTHNTSFLQLTSIAPENQTRRILATISQSSNAVPDGTMLTLSASSCASCTGTVGTPGSVITLQKGINSTLINSISSGYTGTTSGNGFRLNYTWQVNPATYASLRATQSVPIVVVFTITSN